MPGVSWSQRQPTDWLASNGRWYAATSYPRGWSTSALPPAPGHGGIGSILRRYADSAAALAGVGPAAGGPSASGGPYDDAADFGGFGDDDAWQPSEFGQSDDASSAVARSGRTVADATVTAQRTHAMRVEAGAPPPPAIGSSAGSPNPPAPGRIRDTPAAASPPAPVKTNTPYIPKPSPPAKTVDVIAGDLGRVLGTAKRRIEKAIDDAAQA